jgi:hypothetical protein
MKESLKMKDNVNAALQEQLNVEKKKRQLPGIWGFFCGHK